MELHGEDLVLVAVVPRAQDLEIARVLGWYRVPVKRAPKMLAVDWLALYQTARCGPGPAGIYAIAPVLGHELATRGELLRSESDHPHAHEAYYKLQLGTLLQLPRPLVDGAWPRLTFLYTTGERLVTARTLRQLKITAPVERQALWRALRERASSSSAYTPAAMSAIDPSTWHDLRRLTGRDDSSSSGAMSDRRTSRI